MLVRSAGFLDKSMIRSANALNFAYAPYLKPQTDLGNDPNIERWVRRWSLRRFDREIFQFPESRMDTDIKAVHERGKLKPFWTEIEAADLSDAFWEVGLIQNLTTTSPNAPAIKVYWAAQANLGDKGFLSRISQWGEMLRLHGDVHHIFPKNYLNKQGFTKAKYNQVANFVYVQQEINIKIGDARQNSIFRTCLTSETGELKHGATVINAHSSRTQNGMPTDIGDVPVGAL